jgi:hypothetical protein
MEIFDRRSSYRLWLIRTPEVTERDAIKEKPRRDRQLSKRL